jgi:hypothetical protein
VFLRDEYEIGRERVGDFINWWCNLIGITDQLSIQIAGGIVACTCLYIVGVLTWTAILLLVRSVVEQII